MAKNDELDQLLQDSRITADEWKSLYDAVKETYPSQGSQNERREIVNKAMRHAWGHSLMNAFREWYEPDYAPIVKGTAEYLTLPVKDHHTVPETEARIIAEIIDRAKDQIIKERGPEAWERIEQESAAEIERKIQRGEISEAAASQLRGLGPAAMMAALIGGRLAGFALYIVVNQIFFAISRALGLSIGVAVAGPIIGGMLHFLLGPAGWLIAGGWLAYELGDTNWSKVIPGVVLIGCIRARLAEK